jgi:hypothetical protein
MSQWQDYSQTDKVPLILDLMTLIMILEYSVFTLKKISYQRIAVRAASAPHSNTGGTDNKGNV